MKLNTSMFSRFPILLLLGFLAIFGVAFTLISTRDSSPSPNVPTSFSVESGPDTIGWSRLWVIRNKSTGQKFVLSESASGGDTNLTPLAEPK